MVSFQKKVTGMYLLLKATTRSVYINNEMVFIPNVVSMNRTISRCCSCKTPNTFLCGELVKGLATLRL